MVMLKRRLEQAEEAKWRSLIEAADCYLEGRSVADVEFFCIHGYLPEVTLPGRQWNIKRLPWKEEWKQLKAYQRAAATKSPKAKEFFCAHGYWPTKSWEEKNGNS
jgi:hypothetical protein